ncbi:hypothetical protein TRIATDRAFT_281606 [Trichoderma atroviride IMI 206040]|uniref:Protamine P1 n=1 Tax=Hypocrea atroviridis (strain ATCC 20476 / IMI 206040) TaxID=452589 RepID=G9NLS0_HYPAI|nr:uncharacterized protein TRIATDRAFT_281606 [Trichoderma atroviride IMI 206040]EHK48829.1 hypothetical protein TRIATDRAFT_281606 [Trichoderma atroviride IMI 206040]
MLQLVLISDFAAGLALDQSESLDIDARVPATAVMLRRAPIYCEAVLQPQDVYYEGSEDEDYDSAEARRQRYEAAGQRFLQGNVPLLLSATLKGPFEQESGWVNPWRSKLRTANSQKSREPDDINVHSTPKRPATSATVKHAIEALKGAECALPSPESLKQTPLTSPSSRLQGIGHTTHDWRPNSARLSRNSDEFWTTNSPSKTPKRKSKSSPGLDSVANKRQRTRSTEPEFETPTPRKNQTPKRDASQRGRTSRANSDASSIYLHIRELTSQLPPAGSQDLSSEEADTDTDDDHHETISTRSSVDTSLVNARRTPKKDSPSKSLHLNGNSSTSLLSPFSQRSLRGVSSPLSISPAQTPTKRKAASSLFSGRRRASGDLSRPSETSTNLPGLADLEMLGVDDGNSEDLDDATLIERQLRDEQPLSPEDSETSNGGQISTTSDTVPPTLQKSGSSYEERQSGEENAVETPKAKKVDHLDSSISNHDSPRRRLKLFRATHSSRMADPLIYDDTEGSDQPTSKSDNTASLNSQQSVPSEKTPINSPKPNKRQPLGKSPTKTSSPHKSSPLRSLSPRNGRINSRPALKKMVQPYMSSLRKSLAASADETRHAQEEDDQQSNENEQAKEAKETALPPVSSTPASHPSPNEDATEKDYESDNSSTDNAQELVEHGTSTSTTLHSRTPPVDAAASVEVINSTQGDVPLSILQQDEPSLTTPEMSSGLQPSMPVEQANSDVIAPQINRDMLGRTSEPSSIAPVADGDRCEDRQEQEEIHRPAEAVTESHLLPSQNNDAPQPPPNVLPEPLEEIPKRPTTPEPQFAVASFSTFMSPSPNPRRRFYFSGPGLSGTASKTQGTLLSCMKRSWGSTIPKKRVSWAPLPHEGSDSSGEDVPSGTDTSSSMTRGRDRAVSPPPPPSMGSSSDSLLEGDLKFGLHFAAVADRSKGTNPQSTPAVTPSADRECPAEKVDALQVKKNRFATKTATKTWGHDDEDPTDIVQDIFNDMDDFLQVWDVDAELNEARKAEKTRASGAKEAERPEEDADMFASFL